MNEYEPDPWVVEYRDFKTLTSHASGEFIRFYLTTGHEGITYTHSQLEEGANLPRYSCRLKTGDGEELVLTLKEWRHRLDAVGAAVRGWIRAHVTLRNCTLESGRYQGDPYWKAQLQSDNR